MKSSRAVYRDADLTLADGKPVVWLSRLAATPDRPALKARVTGSDLFWELARASERTGLRLFFLGGSAGASGGDCASDLAKAAVLRRYPGAQICGTYCPPFETFATDEEAGAHRPGCPRRPARYSFGRIRRPKQEKWIAANKERLSVPVSIGVGGSFEMAGGVVRRAPKVMQDLGLEWAYRFLQEPTRLWDRYFVRDLPFLVTLVRRTLAERRRCEAAPTAVTDPKAS